MFQLVLPFIRSTTAGRASRRRKIKIYGDKKTLPCVFCKRDLLFHEATIEHIIPRSRGGGNVKENIAISCANCNNRRQSRDFEEWKKIAPYDKLVRLLMKSNKIVGKCLR